LTSSRPDRPPAFVSGIVLAAGTSSRLGRPKQLLDLGGRGVLERVLDAAGAASLDEVVVVLGHAAEEIEKAVAFGEGVRSVANPDYLLGQSTSLRAGLGAVTKEAEAAVILLGDQPGVRTEAIRMVVAAWRDGAGPIVQASYGGRPAHPTLLAMEVWPKLEELTGDEGARTFIAAHRRMRTLVEVGGEPPDDIDTEEDYRRVLSKYATTGAE
jgi:molybdenum cofactor cytidylyltransferase